MATEYRGEAMQGSDKSDERQQRLERQQGTDRAAASGRSGGQGEARGERSTRAGDAGQIPTAVPRRRPSTDIIVGVSSSNGDSSSTPSRTCPEELANESACGTNKRNT